MLKTNRSNTSGNRIRVLRIAHASLTPALRERERALARSCPQIDLEVVTAARWREAEVNVSAATNDLFPVSAARTHLSRHIQLFAYDPRPIIAALKRHRPHLIDLNHEFYSVACAEVLALCDWFQPSATIVIQAAQNIFRKYPPPFSWLEKRALRRAAAAYVCNDQAGEVLRSKGFTRLIHVIPFGVSIDVFRPRQTKDSRPTVPTIGFVGRMMPGKGLDILAEALGQIVDEPWQLLVVGDGADRDKFARALAGRGLLDRARLMGAVPHERIAESYQQMDVLVVPTVTTKRIREQFGRVIVEAMASAVPVIGSTCGAIPKVIDRAGLIFPEGDAAALADRLRDVLSDGALRERLAQAGRDRAKHHYSWDKVAEQTFKLFHKVLFDEQAELQPSSKRRSETHEKHYKRSPGHGELGIIDG